MSTKRRIGGGALAGRNGPTLLVRGPKGLGGPGTRGRDFRTTVLVASGPRRPWRGCCSHRDTACDDSDSYFPLNGTAQ